MRDILVKRGYHEEYFTLSTYTQLMRNLQEGYKYHNDGNREDVQSFESVFFHGTRYGPNGITE